MLCEIFDWFCKVFRKLFCKKKEQASSKEEQLHLDEEMQVYYNSLCTWLRSAPFSWLCIREKYHRREVKVNSFLEAYAFYLRIPSLSGYVVHHSAKISTYTYTLPDGQSKLILSDKVKHSKNEIAIIYLESVTTNFEKLEIFFMKSKHIKKMSRRKSNKVTT